MAKKDATSQIQVDLKILKDENFNKLAELSGTLGSLEIALGTYAEQLKNAVSQLTSGSGRGVSPFGSKAEPLDFGTFSKAGDPPLWLPKNLGGSRDDPNASSKRQARATAHSGPSTGLAAIADKLGLGGLASGMLGFADDALGLHSMSPGLRKLLMGAGGADLFLRHTPKGTKLAANNAFLGAVSEILPEVQIGLIGAGVVQQGESFVRNMRNTGRQVGAGFTEGIKETVDPFFHSWFGFNPLWSTGQAQAAQAAVRTAGWMGPQASKYIGAIQSVYQHTGFGSNAQEIQTTMQMLDSATRFGVNSLGDITSALDRMPSVARSAHMSLTQLVTDINSVASGLQETTGMPFVQAVNAISTFTQVTGLPPQQAASAINNNILQMYQWARSGQTPLQQQLGGNLAQSRLSEIQGFAGRITGVPFDQWQGLLNNPKTREAFIKGPLSRLQLIQDDPTVKAMLGGMNVPQLIALSTRKNTLGMAHGLDIISQLRQNDREGAVTIGGMIHAAGLSGAQARSFSRYVTKGLDKAGLGGGIHDHLTNSLRRDFQAEFGTSYAVAKASHFAGKHGTEEKDWLTKRHEHILNIMQSWFEQHAKQTNAEKHHLYIALTPDAKRLIKVMNDNVYDRNTTGNYSLPANIYPRAQRVVK